MSLINKIRTGESSSLAYTPSIPTVAATLPSQVAAYFPYSQQAGVMPMRKWRVSLADLQSLGAFTTGDIYFHVNQPGAITLRTLVRPNVALTDAVGGTGSNVALSAATARILTVPINSAANASATHSYGTAYDVFQAVGAAVFDFDGTHAGVESLAAQSWVILRVTTTGANLSALTNGSIDVWYEYTTVSV